MKAKFTIVNKNHYAPLEVWISIEQTSMGQKY